MSTDLELTDTHETLVVRDQSQTLAALEAETLSLLDHDPHDVRALTLLAELYVEAGNYAGARSKFFEAARLRPESFSLLMNCAMEFMRDRQFGVAARFAQMALRQDNKNPSVLMFMGMCQLSGDRVHFATDMINAAVRMDPSLELDTGFYQAFGCDETVIKEAENLVKIAKETAKPVVNEFKPSY